MKLSSKQISVAAISGLIFIFIFFTVLTNIVSGNFFFWDTVQLGSRHAHFFYENNFDRLFLPDEIDSGHIPSFGMYLALAWKVFGKSLTVSHFSTLPFLYGIIFQTWKLARRYFSPQVSLMLSVLVLADPTFLGQSVLISPDIPLVFFFLLGLNSILKNNRIFIALSITGLILLSNRGVFLSVAVIICDVIINLKYSGLKSFIIKIIRRFLLYMPAIILFVAYNMFHFKAKGWLGYHEDSPWAPSFELVNIKGLFYNAGILIWRLLDFGRIFLWITGLVLCIYYFRKNRRDREFRNLGIILLLSLFILSLPMLAYEGLSGHRYLLPVYLVFAFLTGYLLFKRIESGIFRNFLYIISLAGLLTGNLWIYPEKISQGWDSSLAHLPYYELLQEMNAYLEQHEIDINKVGCSFPNLAEQKYLTLNNDHRSFHAKDIDTDRLILYSNIYNDFKDYEIEMLNTNFSLIKEVRQGRIFIRLYENKP